jgi:hypothetical protein
MTNTANTARMKPMASMGEKEASDKDESAFILDAAVLEAYTQAMVPPPPTPRIAIRRMGRVTVHRAAF